MTDILNRPLNPDDDDTPMPDDIKLLFSWLNENNAVLTLSRTDEIIAEMRRLRAISDDGPPVKASEKEEEPIDITKLVLKGKPLAAPAATVRVRR